MIIVLRNQGYPTWNVPVTPNFTIISPVGLSVLTVFVPGATVTSPEAIPAAAGILTKMTPSPPSPPGGLEFEPAPPPPPSPSVPACPGSPPEPPPPAPPGLGPPSGG